MEKGIKSKRKILEVAFKLFSAYSYPDVSYSLLEEATGISRGSMVYYFNNKEGIFRAVLETFLFGLGSAHSVPQADRTNLRHFINTFIDRLLEEVKPLKAFRINNLCDARFTIERSALQFVPEFRQSERKVLLEDVATWKQVICNAVESGEVRKVIDCEEMARLFTKICGGWLYTGIYNTMESDDKIEELRRLLLSQYALIANS